MGNKSIKSSPETQSSVINSYVKNYNVSNLITDYLKDLPPLPYLEELLEVSRHTYDLDEYQYYSNFTDVDRQYYRYNPDNIRRLLDASNRKSNKFRIYEQNRIHIIKFCLSCFVFHIGKPYKYDGLMKVIINHHNDLSSIYSRCLKLNQP